MRTFLLLVVAALFAGTGAQARTWTNTEGQTLEAELVKVEHGQVYLRLAKDRKVRPLKIEMLSEADQEFIKQYEQDKLAQQKAEKLAKRKAKWLDDYDDIKAAAEEFDLPILLLYTAPEWCGPCRSLESNVLDSSGFMEFAGKNLILLKVDCSNSKDKENWLEDNKELAEKCKLEYFPMMYFLSSNMEKLGMIGGYEPEWDLDKYLAEMGKIIDL